MGVAECRVSDRYRDLPAQAICEPGRAELFEELAAPRYQVMVTAVPAVTRTSYLAAASSSKSSVPTASPGGCASWARWR